MKTKVPQFILMTALLTGGAVVMTWETEAPLGPMPLAKPAIDSRPTPKVSNRGSSAPKAALVEEAALIDGDAVPANRNIAEVFPEGGSPTRDWRTSHPDTLKVAAYPGKFLTFHRTRTREEGRHLTWVGLNDELPGASFVGVATPDGYDAVLLLPGAAQYNFHARGQSVLVEEVVSSGKDCEIGTQGAGLPLALSKSVGAIYAEAGSASGNISAIGGTAAAGEAALKVDVLFLYNTRALAVAADRSPDPVGYIDGYARAGLETCNQVLLNSRVENFSWRYIGLVAAPAYPEKQTVSEDLAMIAPDGPLDSFVRSVRAEYGADQVLMWVGPGTRQGAAYTGDVRGTPVPVEWSLAGLRLTAGILILAHELAHNFGCQHDRGHAGSGDGSTATPEGDGRWCYGLLWNDPGGASTSGTIMAYADFLVPHFSNPDISLNITSTLQNRPGPFLDFGTRIIGFPESDPRASNNARVMREYAAHMAALAEETETTPVILRQPAGAVVPEGQTLSLAVSAVGGGLGYQWMKEGADVPGATAANFTKTFAAADAGNYSVRIANRRGSVISRVVAVSLPVSIPSPVVPVTPSPAAPAVTGGGGGGGAPSGWFLLALVALGWTRLCRIGRRGGARYP